MAMSMALTFTDEVIGRLQVLGMNETDIEECVPYVIQKVNQDSLFKEWYSPDIWQQSVIKTNDKDRRRILMDCLVLPEVIRWLLNQKNTLEATLQKFHQEIHRLSRPANEQGTAE